MNTNLDPALLDGYISGSQRARRVTEAWVASNSYCPSCGNLKLSAFPNNNPVGDFYCPNCKQEYELKSSRSAFRTEILDGAYSSMIRRIQSNNNPNFFLMNYSLIDMAVSDFAVIPRHFFVPDIIIQRKPLADTARRAGWVGCNISLNRIPDAGKIYLVRNGRPTESESVLKSWKETAFLSGTPIESRGWLLEMLSILESLPNEFMLADVYESETELQKKFPLNRFVRDKIRQQLQVLRDQGFLIFEGKGRYRKSMK